MLHSRHQQQQELVGITSSKETTQDRMQEAVCSAMQTVSLEHASVPTACCAHPHQSAQTTPAASAPPPTAAAAMSAAAAISAPPPGLSAVAPSVSPSPAAAAEPAPLPLKASTSSTAAGQAANCIAAGAAAAIQLPSHAATAQQLEELEALEAIFMAEYTLISSTPPHIATKLREPGTGSDGDDDSDAGGGGGDCQADILSRPPSRQFTLKFKLPADYPQAAIPITDIVGPLGGNDPRRHALLSFLQTAAHEQQDRMGDVGYIYQLVEAAKQWIDAHIPVDVGQRREGQGSLPAAAPGTMLCADGTEGTDPSGASPATLIEASQLNHASAAGGATAWWEAEVADGALIKRAMAQAGKYTSQAWLDSTGLGEAPGSSDGSSSSSWDVQGSGMAPDQRGRWDYVIGLVGKPSAGKSTFFNAVTGECYVSSQYAHCQVPECCVSSSVESRSLHCDL